MTIHVLVFTHVIIKDRRKYNIYMYMYMQSVAMSVYVSCISSFGVRVQEPMHTHTICDY